MNHLDGGECGRVWLKNLPVSCDFLKLIFNVTIELLVSCLLEKRMCSYSRGVLEDSMDIYQLVSSVYWDELKNEWIGLSSTSVDEKLVLENLNLTTVVKFTC